MLRRPCVPRSEVHIVTQLRCYEPRGAKSCGSPMPRGERIAKPAEWDTHAAGCLFGRRHGARRTDPTQGDTMFTRHFATLARVLLLAVLGGWLLHPSIALAQTSDSAPVGRADSVSFVAVSAGGWHTCAVTLGG